MIVLQPDLVISFHNNLAASKGTRDCVLRAIKRKYITLLVAEHESTSALQPSVWTDTPIEPQDGKPESILQQALQRLHPLTW